MSVRLMAEADALQPRWDDLVGLDLSAVVFVRDYLQLQFDGPGLSIYSARKNKGGRNLYFLCLDGNCLPSR